MIYPIKAHRALRTFLHHTLVVDPWLSPVRGIDTIPRAVDALVGQLAQDIMAYPLDRSEMGTLPLSREYLYNAAREVLISSAAFEAHLNEGSVSVTAPRIMEASRRLHAFVRSEGLPGLFFAYALAAGTENMMAVQYYGRMSEEDFLSGRLHRPWISRSLEPELQLGLAARTIRLEAKEGRRWVRLTAEGRRTLKSSVEIWEETGYLKARDRMLAVAQFNEMADWDELSDGIMPGLRADRRSFVDAFQPNAADHVLEVGTGTGLLTFEAGLADRVQQVTALDPSVAMMARAQGKARERGLTSVRFVQGMAEQMPFPDESFDAVISFGVLQYTDRPQAIAEIARVLKPGGRFAISVAVQQPLFGTAIIRQWFAEIERGSRPNDVFPHLGEIPALCQASGLAPSESVPFDSWVELTQPERVVRTFLQFRVYQNELLAVPYAARLRLLEDLEGRGRFLVASAHPDTLRVPSPLEWTFGHRPGPTC